MDTMDVRRGTLAVALWPAGGMSRLARDVALVVLGSILLTVSAKIQVPFWPVPMTMHTFAVMIIGAAFGARLGGATVLAYLAQGAAGIPVFAGGAGLAYLAGPTGGFLVGFFFAAVLIGWLAERGLDRHLLTAAATFVVGNAVIFALGIGWLTVLIGFEQAIAGGLLPFIPGELLKIALAVAMLPMAWRALRHMRG